MTNLTAEQIIKNLHLRGFDSQTERNAEIVANVQNDAVVFAGQGKNHKIVHIISGDSKAAYQPNAVCGVWVSNKMRAPLATEKVCSKCTRGGTSFTKWNQPRECQSCGKMFADNASRDNTSETCGACYEIAGHENAHMDGFHADEIEPECPMCQTAETETVATCESKRVWRQRVKCTVCGETVKVKRDSGRTTHVACR